MGRVHIHTFHCLVQPALLMLFWQIFCAACAAQETDAKTLESRTAWTPPSTSWRQLDSEIDYLRQRVAVLEERAANEAAATCVRHLPAVTSFEAANWNLPSSEGDTRERYPTLSINGFIHLDSAWFGESEASRMITGDIADITAIRRARVAVSGHLCERVTYKTDVEFAGPGSPRFRDVFLGFEDVPLLQNVRVGKFRAPFELDALTSSNDFTFAERAPQFTFVPFRQLGVGANGTNWAETATWACSAYRFPTDGLGIAQADNGYGFSTRASFLPWHRDDERGLLHIGGAYSFINPGGDVIRYEVESAFFVSEDADEPSPVPPLLDTGPIDAEDMNLFGVELAGTLGPFHVQSELTYSLVNQIGGPPLAFYGAYAQVGWFLTGESRPYDRQRGAFNTLRPLRDFSLHGGPGAWEIAARWSHTNLNDENITGGELSTLECALNWYWSRRLKVKALYARSFVKDPTMGDAELDVVGGRLQAVY